MADADTPVPAEPVAAESWDTAGTSELHRPEDMFQVDLEGFEGPLDLLLAMARTQKVDIRRISVLALAEQYLSFIRDAKSLRIEIAADYLVMAAWLAFLKSRLLLPKEKEEASQPSGEEMALRLQFRLMRLQAMRNAAAALMTRKRLGVEVFARGGPEGFRTIRERQYTAEIYDLLRAYTDQRKRTTVRRAHVVRRRPVWSIKEARNHLQRLVGASTGQWVQLDMFLEQYLPSAELGRTALAASFGATLEMARDGLVEIRQEEPFAPIYMRRREDGASWVKVE